MAASADIAVPGLVDHTSRAHAKLSPSGAYRWMNCAGSVEAQEGLPDQQSEFAAEGTAAHELSERCLAKGYNPDRFLGDQIQVGQFTFNVDPDMADHVSTYVQTIRQDYKPGDDLSYEQRYPLDPFLPGQFGTSDAVNYRPGELLLRVYDLKFGQGIPVEVSDNWQLTCYGLGALMAARRPVREVELVIVQPRAPHVDGPVRRWRLSAVEMMERGAALQEAGERALRPGAPRKAGKWCKFCKAAATCETLQSYSLAEAQMVFADMGVLVEPPPANTLDPVRLGHLLHAADVIEAWIKDLRAYAFSQAAAGGSTPTK
jgi:hypothetical protein